MRPRLSLPKLPGLGPLKLAGVTLHVQRALPALSAAETQDPSVAPHEVHPCAGGDLLTAETTLMYLRQRLHLPDLPGLALCIAQKQYVVDTHRPLHVPCDDPSLVPAFLDPDSYLHDLARQPRPTKDLDDCRGCEKVRIMAHPTSRVPGLS